MVLIILDKVIISKGHCGIMNYMNQHETDNSLYFLIVFSGKSWPIDCDDGNSKNEKGLIYSADT